MQEQYYSAFRVKKLSPAAIRKMKENMQKVPLVQAQSEAYHQKEEEKAEKLLTHLTSESSTKVLPKVKIKQKKKL